MKNSANSKERKEAMLAFDCRYWSKGLIIAGMDEVGRGPLAGPVVAACVIMPANSEISGVDDSKKLSSKQRERLYHAIVNSAVNYGVGWVWQDEIDSIGIVNATKKAFKEAFNSLETACDYVLVDAVRDIDISAKQIPLIHGDALSYSIASASIVAKVLRDKYMENAAKEFPEYGFERHKGYGTRAHIEAIRENGLCKLHRRTFTKSIIHEDDCK